MIQYNVIKVGKGSADVNQNEYYYRRVIGAVGTALLFFLLFINTFGVIIAFFPVLFSLLPIGETAATVLYQLVYAAGYLLSFMLPVPILKRMIQKQGLTYHPMRAEMKLSPRSFLIIPAGIAVVYSAAYVNAAFVSIFQYSAFSSEVLWGSTEVLPQPFEWVLEFIVLCIVPGFCEEFLFRGAILTNCLPFGRSNAIMISSFLFAMMHQNAEQILYTFAAGIVLGIVYEMTGNLWACTFLHIANNFFSLYQSAIALKFRQMLASTVAVAVVESVLFLIGVISVAILVVRFFSHKTELRDGFFGKTIPAADGYATYPVATKRAVRLFLTPTMTIFLVISVLQMIFLMGMAVLYGIFAG